MCKNQIAEHRSHELVGTTLKCPCKITNSVGYNSSFGKKNYAKRPTLCNFIFFTRCFEQIQVEIITFA